MEQHTVIDMAQDLDVSKVFIAIFNTWWRSSENEIYKSLTSLPAYNFAKGTLPRFSLQIYEALGV